MPGSGNEVRLPRTLFVPMMALVLLLGCGGGVEGSSFATVDPEPRTVAVGDQLPLAAHATVDLDGDLEWEVQEPYGGGLRNSQGETTVYFAPEGAGTYHLVLRAARTDGRRLKQTLEIKVLPLPMVDPPSAQVGPGGSVSFTATMKGLPRNTVTWEVVEPGGGDISEDGRYQPPAKPGIYHVRAVSTLNPDVSAQATVTVGN
jgi:hypothetical protein